MTGMEMLLKNALTAVFKAMGVTGEEIVQKFEELKTAIPAFAQQAQARLESIDTRLKKLEEEFTLVHMKLDALLKIDSDPFTLPAGTGPATTPTRMTNGTTEWPVLGGDHTAVEDGKWLATNGQ